MKTITVAMEVSPSGEVIREAFTMVHRSLKSAENYSKSLPKAFSTRTYKTKWETPRVKIADAIVKRGNEMAFKTYLF
jgi:hypothetical protein